jgi:hypothetical protein
VVIEFAKLVVLGSGGDDDGVLLLDLDLELVHPQVVSAVHDDDHQREPNFA